MISDEQYIGYEKEKCRKKKAYDKRGAQTMRNLLWKNEHKELKIYPCPWGAHWHLTSTGDGE